MSLQTCGFWLSQKAMGLGEACATVLAHVCVALSVRDTKLARGVVSCDRGRICSGPCYVMRCPGHVMLCVVLKPFLSQAWRACCSNVAFPDPEADPSTAEGSS